jgi:hypothetical protein
MASASFTGRRSRPVSGQPRPWRGRARLPPRPPGAGGGGRPGLCPVPVGGDLLIVNRFGKHEAGGRGVRSVPAAAVARDVPVLAGLHGWNREAFEAFAKGLARHLPPGRAALAAWAEDVEPRAAEVA